MFREVVLLVKVSRKGMHLIELTLDSNLRGKVSLRDEYIHRRDAGDFPLRLPRLCGEKI